MLCDSGVRWAFKSLHKNQNEVLFRVSDRPRPDAVPIRITIVRRRFMRFWHRCHRGYYSAGDHGSALLLGAVKWLARNMPLTYTDSTRYSGVSEGNIIIYVSMEAVEKQDKHVWSLCNIVVKACKSLPAYVGLGCDS